MMQQRFLVLDSGQAAAEDTGQGSAVFEVLLDSENDGLQAAVDLTATTTEDGQFTPYFQSRGVRGSTDLAKIAAAVLDETLGSVIVWFDPDTAYNDAARPATGAVLGWADSASARLRLVHLKANTQFRLQRQTAGAGEVGVSDASFTAGQALCLYGGWNATTIEIALNGGAITSAANTTIPTLASTQIEVGSDGLGASRFNGAFAAVAFFDRKLTAEEWAYFAALDRPPLFGEHVGRSMSGLWVCGESSYYDNELDILTPDVRSCTYERGRDFPSTRAGRSAAGALQAILKNNDGRYSPLLDTSPLFEKALPNRQLRVRAATRYQHWNRWSGFLDAAPAPRYAGNGIYEARLSAKGPLYALSGRSASVLPQADIYTGTAMGLVLDAAGWPSGDRDLATGKQSMFIWYADNLDAFSALREIEDTEGPGAFLREGADGKVVFEDRHFRLTGARLTSQATFSDDVDAANKITELEPFDPIAEVFNAVEVAIPIFNDPEPEIDLWTWIGDPIRLVYDNPGLGIYGTVAVVTARYPQANDLAGSFVQQWSDLEAEDFEFIAGSFSDLTITTTKSANEMQIVLRNTVSAADVVIDRITAKGTPSIPADSSKTVAEDETSQAKFGRRVWPLAPKWLSGGLENASQYANAELVRRANPVPIFRVGVNPIASKAHMDVCLGLDLSQRVTIDADASPFGIDVVEVYVERLVESFESGGREHRLSFDCSSAVGDSGWWVLGIDALGSGTVLAY